MTVANLALEVNLLKEVTLGYIRGADAAYAEDIKVAVAERGASEGASPRAISLVAFVIDGMDPTPRPLRAEDVRVRLEELLSILESQ
jgi:hypothetical protein